MTNAFSQSSRYAAVIRQLVILQTGNVHLSFVIVGRVMAHLGHCTLFLLDRLNSDLYEYRSPDRLYVSD